MAHRLEDLQIGEVSLVDRPANSELDPVSGLRIKRATVALLKRDFTEDDILKAAVDGQMVDGKVFPASDFAYVPDKSKPSTWKLRLTKTPGGDPDPGIVGAAAAALGPGGFRGNPVSIPSDARAAVKAKVRAAWHKANPDKGEDDMPESIRKGEGMTLAEMEVKVNKQDEAIAALRSDNEVLKAENELVLKMSKGERKLYRRMSADQRKEYMAGDSEKRAGMMKAAADRMEEEKLMSSFSDEQRDEYQKAGPKKKAAMLAKLKAQKAQKDDDCDDDEAMDKKKVGKGATDLVVAELHDKLAKESSAREQLATTVTKMTESHRLVEFTKRAEAELPNTAGTPVEKGQMLMSLVDSLPGGENGEQFKKVFAAMKDADKTLGMHFHEVGKLGGGEMPAQKVLDAKVQEIMKRDGINESKAMAKVFDEAPQLVLDVDAQKRQVVAAR